jgi:hypothetical protein
VWLDVLQWWGKGSRISEAEAREAFQKDKGVNPAGDTFLANLWAL